MVSGKPFDQANYWINRHKEKKGDPRAVGFAGNTFEEGVQEEKEFIADMGVLFKRLLERFPLRSMLDLGCGFGRIAPTAVGLGLEYNGVELSGLAVERARKRCPVGRFVEANILKWRPERKFDLVLASWVLIHLVENDQWEKALDVIAAAVAPKGIIMIIEQIPSAHRKIARHVVHRGCDEYERALAARGLILDGMLTKVIVGETQGTKTFDELHLIRHEQK